MSDWISWLSWIMILIPNLVAFCGMEITPKRLKLVYAIYLIIAVGLWLR